MSDETPREISYKQKDGTLDLRALMTGVIQKCLGQALDYGRMSGMSDRNFTQFQRSLKDIFYATRDFSIKMLEDEGLLKSDETK